MGFLLFITFLGSGTLYAGPIGYLCKKNSLKSQRSKNLQLEKQCEPIGSENKMKFEYEMEAYCNLEDSQVTLKTSRNLKAEEIPNCNKKSTLDFILAKNGEVSDELQSYCPKDLGEHLRIAYNTGSDASEFVFREYVDPDKASFVCSSKKKLNGDSYLLSTAEFDTNGEIYERRYYARHCILKKQGFFSTKNKLFCLLVNPAKCHSADQLYDYAHKIHKTKLDSSEYKQVLEKNLETLGVRAATATDILLEKKAVKGAIARLFSSEGGEAYANNITVPNKSDWVDLANQPEIINFLGAYKNKCSKLFAAKKNEDKNQQNNHTQ